MFGVNVFEFKNNNDNVGGGCGHSDTIGNVRVCRSLGGVRKLNMFYPMFGWRESRRKMAEIFEKLVYSNHVSLSFPLRLYPHLRLFQTYP